MTGIATLASMSSRALGSLSSPGYWMAFISTGELGQCAVDPQGNIYHYGIIASPPITASRRFQLVKFSPTGQRLWSRDLVTELRNSRGICVDSNSNVYVASQLGTGTLQTIEVIKLDSSGNLLNRLRVTPPAEYDTVTFYTSGNIAVDSSNNLYVAGYYRIKSDGTSQSFVHKYDSSGALTWQVKLSVNPIVTAIVPDKDGNIYVVGRQQLTASSEGFVLKLNSSGTLLWQYSTNFWPVGGNTDIKLAAVDAQNSLYVAGLNGDGGGLNTNCIFKISSAGSFVWAKSISYNSNQTIPKFVVTDANSNLYLGNTVSATATYIGVSKYDSNGNVQWSRTLNRTVPNSSILYAAPGISNNLDNSSNLIFPVQSYVCATPTGILYYSGPVKFPPNGGETGTYLTLVSSSAGVVTPDRTITTTYEIPSTVVDTSVSVTWASASYTIAAASLVPTTVSNAVSISTVRTYLTQV